MKCDELTQAMIDEAREMPPPFTPGGLIEPEPEELPLELRGDEMHAYLQFKHAAKALEENQKRMPVLTEQYYAALKRLSAVAAKEAP